MGSFRDMLTDPTSMSGSFAFLSTRTIVSQRYTWSALHVLTFIDHGLLRNHVPCGDALGKVLDGLLLHHVDMQCVTLLSVSIQALD